MRRIVSHVMVEISKHWRNKEMSRNSSTNHKLKKGIKWLKSKNRHAQALPYLTYSIPNASLEIPVVQDNELHE